MKKRLIAFVLMFLIIVPLFVLADDTASDCGFWCQAGQFLFGSSENRAGKSWFDRGVVGEAASAESTTVGGSTIDAGTRTVPPTYSNSISPDVVAQLRSGRTVRVGDHYYTNSNLVDANNQRVLLVADSRGNVIAGTTGDTIVSYADLNRGRVVNPIPRAISIENTVTYIPPTIETAVIDQPTVVTPAPTTQQNLDRRVAAIDKVANDILIKPVPLTPETDTEGWGVYTSTPEAGMTIHSLGSNTPISTNINTDQSEPGLSDDVEGVFVDPDLYQARADQYRSERERIAANDPNRVIDTGSAKDQIDPNAALRAELGTPRADMQDGYTVKKRALAEHVPAPEDATDTTLSSAQQSYLKGKGFTDEEIGTLDYSDTESLNDGVNNYYLSTNGNLIRDQPKNGNIFVVSADGYETIEYSGELRDNYNPNTHRTSVDGITYYKSSDGWKEEKSWARDPLVTDSSLAQQLDAADWSSNVPGVYRDPVTGDYYAVARDTETANGYIDVVAPDGAGAVIENAETDGGQLVRIPITASKVTPNAVTQISPTGNLDAEDIGLIQDEQERRVALNRNEQGADELDLERNSGPAATTSTGSTQTTTAGTTQTGTPASPRTITVPERCGDECTIASNVITNAADRKNQELTPPDVKIGEKTYKPFWNSEKKEWDYFLCEGEYCKLDLNPEHAQIQGGETITTIVPAVTPTPATRSPSPRPAAPAKQVDPVKEARDTISALTTKYQEAQQGITTLEKRIEDQKAKYDAAIKAGNTDEALRLKSSIDAQQKELDQKTKDLEKTQEKILEEAAKVDQMSGLSDQDKDNLAQTYRDQHKAAVQRETVTKEAYNSHDKQAKAVKTEVDGFKQEDLAAIKERLKAAGVSEADINTVKDKKTLEALQTKLDKETKDLKTQSETATQDLAASNARMAVAGEALGTEWVGGSKLNYAYTFITATPRYPALSNAIFGDHITWKASTERFFANTYLGGWLETAACDSMIDIKEPGSGTAMMEVSPSVFQFVGSIQAERSPGANYPLSCDDSEETPLPCPNQLLCKSGLCFKDNTATTPEMGYFYKITWSVTAPTNVDFIKRTNLERDEVDFNIQLDNKKWLFAPVDGSAPGPNTNHLGKGNNSRQLPNLPPVIVGYFPGLYNKACIVFGDNQPADMRGYSPNPICADFKESASAPVNFDEGVTSSGSSASETSVSGQYCGLQGC